jgi:hypothetical protein
VEASSIPTSPPSAVLMLDHTWLSGVTCCGVPLSCAPPKTVLVFESKAMLWNSVLTRLPMTERQMPVLFAGMVRR